MDAYGKIANKIIKDQRFIMGPLATQIAGRVIGMTVENHQVTFLKDPKEAIQNLVIEYRKVFGDASVEICKESAHSIDVNVSMNELPDILK